MLSLTPIKKYSLSCDESVGILYHAEMTSTIAHGPQERQGDLPALSDHLVAQMQMNMRRKHHFAIEAVVYCS